MVCRNSLVALILLLCLYPLATHGSTISVSSLNDSGSGSLRQAIASAESGDIIAISVFGTILLESGQLTIDKDLSIAGPGAEYLTIDGNGSSRVFEIAGAIVSISGLTVSGGSAIDGGGIWNSGSLSMEGVVIHGNQASNCGGGVFSEIGSLALTNCTVSGNTAEKNGGGIDAISVTLSGCHVSGNIATGSVYWGGWGGGLVFPLGGSGEISGSTFVDNSAAACGGAICASGSSLILSGSEIAGNRAGVSGGGICLRVGSDLAAWGCTIAENMAEKNGGGLHTETDINTASLTNCTISGNEATGTLYLGGHGGGIGNSVGSFISLTHCTVTMNRAILGGGAENGELLELKSTVFSGNQATTGPNFHGAGIVSSFGWNLIESHDGCAYVESDSPGTDMHGEDPLLGPLADYGGTTGTHALLPGSPAIDAGVCTGIEGATIPEDQRGTLRPQGARCDIGAYEASPAVTLTVVVQGDGTGTVASEPSGIACGSTCSSAFGVGAVVNLTVTPDPGSVFQGWAGDCQGADPNITIIMESNRTCIAAFGLPSQDPVACFTHTPDEPTTLDQIAFLDCSSDADGDIVEWFWAFGDGGTSAVRNPTHRYAEAGSYAVTLTVTDTHGGTDSHSQDLTILAGGDVTGDGKPDVLDMRLILQAALGFITLTQEQQEVADINGDGQITTEDAAALARHLAGMGRS